jgi:hypothetical protein
MAKAPVKQQKGKPMSKPGKKDFSYSDLFEATETIEEYSQIMDSVRDGEGGKKTFVPYMSLDEGGTAEIRFLHHSPIRFFQHREFDRNGKKGAGGWVNLTCTQKLGRCVLCDKGSKASYKCAYLIVHVDAEGGSKVKLFVRGVTDARVLESIDRKMHVKGSDITKVNFEMERIGRKTDTRYTFERTDIKTMPIFDRADIGDAKNEDQYLDFLKSFFKPRKEKMEEIAAMMDESESEGTSNSENDVPF